MQPRISLITLGVRDLQRSLAFYRDGLGLPTTRTADQGIIFFQTTGTCLALYPLDKLAEDVWPPLPSGEGGSSASLGEGPTEAAERLARKKAEGGSDSLPPAKFSGIALAHNVREKSDVDRVLAEAAAAGAKIEKPAADTFWGGYSGYFSDPDGYLWEVAHGAFDFREDGSLIIP